LLVYDITNRKTFANIGKWYEDVKKMADLHAVLMLIGNKSDMSKNRAVSVSEAQVYAGKAFSIKFFHSDFVRIKYKIFT
jgi:GTPase SAR1 family protein